jgi:hypothetical protein
MASHHSGAIGRIAVDAMGGDLGPTEVVAAVKLALQQYAGRRSDHARRRRGGA